MNVYIRKVLLARRRCSVEQQAAKQKYKNKRNIHMQLGEGPLGVLVLLPGTLGEGLGISLVSRKRKKKNPASLTIMASSVAPLLLACYSSINITSLQIQSSSNRCNEPNREGGSARLRINNTNLTAGLEPIHQPVLLLLG